MACSHSPCKERTTQAMEKNDRPKVDDDASVSEGNMELYRLMRTVDMAKKTAETTT